jgi:hypothetical protein
MPSRHFAAGLLSLALVLAACSADEPLATAADPAFAVGTGHNAADHFKIDQPAEFQIENPCNGELIDLTGRETGQVTVVDTRENLDNGNSVHFEHLTRVVATGIGQETGAVYSVNEVFHETFESPSPPAPQVTFSFRDRFRVTSSVPGTAFSVHALFHLVVTPSAGEAKVTQDIESVTCDQ